jgi:hypothetical protein
MKAKIKARKQAKGQNVIHLPRLDTVIMVEDTLKGLDYYPTKNQLWRALPKAVMWQTFGVIIGYLLKSNKILVSRDRRIVWIYADKKQMKRLLKNSVPYEKVRKVYW